MTITLSDKELETLRAARRRSVSWKEGAKISTILGLHQGYSIADLSEILGFDESTEDFYNQ